MKQITVFGATGNVGRLVVAEALARGYAVVAFVHSRPLDIIHPNLVSVTGDLANSADIQKALKGSSVIVSALSSWKAPHHDVLARSMERIIPNAKEVGVSRMISLTGSDAFDATDHPGLLNRLSHAILSVVGRGVLQDGEAHIALLRASTMDWTVIRSPVMTGQKSTKYTLTTDLVPPYASIPRTAVAQAMADEIENTRFIKRAVCILR